MPTMKEGKTKAQNEYRSAERLWVKNYGRAVEGSHPEGVEKKVGEVIGVYQRA